MEEVPASSSEKSPKDEGSPPSLFSKMVDSANEGDILICGIKTVGLIDSGSMITSVSESFYDSLQPKPVLHDITEFGLSVTSATFRIPLLVVNNTDYNSKVPAIIGTNVIRLCKESSPSDNVPVEWQIAFDSMCDDTLPVKTTNNFNIRIGPGEIKTLSGLVRNNKNFQTAVTEHVDCSLSGDLTICPRRVSLKSCSTVRVPVRVCNLSARFIEIPPRSLLCSLSSVDVMDSWTPDSSQKKPEPKTSNSLNELGVKIDTDNLTPEQVSRAKEILGNWSHIFSTGPTDLGRTDLVEHEIKLTDETPFKEPYRRIPPALYEEVRQHLKEMLDAGAIRPSKSPFSSNVVLVRKKMADYVFA